MAASRIIIRQTGSGKLPGLLFLSAILLASVTIPPFHDREFTVCLFEKIFGLPCPGCGMTRAFLFLGHGDVRSALALNLNSLAVFFAAVVLWLQFAFNLATGKEIRIQLMPHERNFSITLAVVAMLSGWVCNLSA